MLLEGWGRYPKHEGSGFSIGGPGELGSQVKANQGLIARGNGRAYGDAAIGGTSNLLARSLDRKKQFDAAASLLAVEGGVLLGDIVDSFLPRGYFLPVVPGTKYVTDGGAIAADVHGKNHHRDGGFGATLKSLALVLPDGRTVTCSATANSDRLGHPRWWPALSRQRCTAVSCYLRTGLSAVGRISGSPSRDRRARPYNVTTFRTAGHMSAPKTLLLIGATSDIGHATAMAFAKANWAVQLTARSLDTAQRNRDDIAVRSGSPVSVAVLDILDTERLESFVDSLVPLPDAVVCVVGEMGDQQRAQTDLAHAALVIRTNFEGPALLLGILAERFMARGHGSIVGVSSVAGDRGRGSNYVYGAAKAGFSAFLSGLRNRATGSNVEVVTIKPGFVRTRMTAGLKLPPLLTAEPEEVGSAILAAVQGKRSNVQYVRKLWWPVMTAICLIPEPIFKKMRL